jgi:hypothetical protein
VTTEKSVDVRPPYRPSRERTGCRPTLPVSGSASKRWYFTGQYRKVPVYSQYRLGDFEWSRPSTRPDDFPLHRALPAVIAHPEPNHGEARPSLLALEYSPVSRLSWASTAFQGRPVPPTDGRRVTGEAGLHAPTRSTAVNDTSHRSMDL